MSAPATYILGGYPWPPIYRYAITFVYAVGWRDMPEVEK